MEAEYNVNLGFSNMPQSTSKADRKLTGSHYTPPVLARFVAEKLVEHYRGGVPRVLDPACGDGELLAAFKAVCPLARLVGFDLDEGAVAATRSRLDARAECKDFLEIALLYRDAGLFEEGLEKFDVAIANPPYIRTQVLGAERSQKIARQFGLAGRIDIYFAFIEGIAELLRPGGVAGIIVSNRFMTTKAGSTVRNRILTRFDVLHVFDLGDSKLFEAAILPAVLILRKKGTLGSSLEKARMSSIYASKPGALGKCAHSPLEALKTVGKVSVGAVTFEVKHGELDSSGGVWRVATDNGDRWLETVRSHTSRNFGDVGKVRVGVKTTADKVFVRQCWDEPKPELLRPLVTHRVARRFRSLPPDRQILYTHRELCGKSVAVDLNEYPNARSYLESYRDVLSARSYVREANRQWFEIWVPHRPTAWKRPKLVFPDISERPNFWMSLDEEVIQGDCYWMTIDDETSTDLLWLALAVGNSSFIEEYYDHCFQNKLYSGRRRFMTQYVEKFPLPDPDTSIAREIVSKAKSIFEETPSAIADKLALELDSKVREAFGVK